MPKKVLLADDDLDFLEVLQSFLEQENFNVILAGSGEEAWQTLIRTPDINLIITDIKMPTMGGIDLVEKITNLLPSPPEVIFISGVSTISQQEAKKFGAKTILYKPINWDDLLNSINS